MASLQLSHMLAGGVFPDCSTSAHYSDVWYFILARLRTRCMAYFRWVNIGRRWLLPSSEFETMEPKQLMNEHRLGV